VDPAEVHAAQASWHDTAWYPLLAGTTPESIAFLAGIAGYDPVPALTRLTCPLLAIFGADDLLVHVDDSVDIIATTLAAAGHEDHQVVVFPHADHGIRVFTGEGRPRVSHGHYMPGQPAPGYAELVVTWLRHRLTR
jgi:pimeloyl-ACP methyl ester carboxylesterase